MRSSRRNLLVGSAVLVALFAAAAWSRSNLDDRKSAAFSAVEDSRACKGLAREIERLRQRQSSPTSEPARQLALTREIARCASEAGIPPRSLDRIEHEPPRHAEGSSTLEKPTRLLIRLATLHQLITFFHGIDRPAEMDRASADSSGRLDVELRIQLPHRRRAK